MHLRIWWMLAAVCLPGSASAQHAVDARLRRQLDRAASDQRIPAYAVLGDQLRGDQLAAMRVGDQFWRARCSASMEIRCHVIVVAGCAENEMVIGLRHEGRPEIEHTVFAGRAWRCDPQEG